MKTLNDLMRRYPDIELSGSAHGFDRYEVEPGVYYTVCPDCGHIGDAPDLGCGNCGYGTMLYDYYADFSRFFELEITALEQLSD